MIRGIIILESGEVQQLGDLTTAAGIIATMKQLLPELEMKERKRALLGLTEEDIKRIAAEIKAEQKNTEKLEP